MVRSRVVDDLVIVPDREDRNRRQKTPQRRILSVVPPYGPELVELGRRDRQSGNLRIIAVAARRFARIVGIDHVAEGNEECRFSVANAIEDIVPSLRIAADVLATQITAPGKT